MKRETSLYLDLARVLAAAAVFIHNAKKETLTSGFLAPFGQFGDEAVIIFFVISGIVIAHTVRTRKDNPAQYMIARLARLWSVVIPALAVTILLDGVGSRLNPAIYDAFTLPLWRADAHSVWSAIAPILFLNQSWFDALGPGSDGPFWSIGYEAPYYFAFGVLVFCRGWVRVLGVIAMAAVMGPSVTVMASFWLLGVVISRFLGRGRQTVLAWAGWLVTLLLIAAFYGAKYKLVEAFSYIAFGTTGFDHDVEYVFPCVAVALLFAVNILCFDRIGDRFCCLGDRLEGPIRFFAARSFSLYLYQAPLLFFFGACATYVQPSAARIAIVYIGTLASVLLLAEVTEKRKHTVAAWLSAATGRYRRFETPQSDPTRRPANSMPVTG